MNHQIATIAPPADLTTIEQISKTVIEAVADASDTSPLELQPLATVIDPDALESLVASMATKPDEPAASVQFPYNGYTVTVEDDGSVAIAE